MLLLSRPLTDTLRGCENRQVRCYRSQFRDRMEMRADFQTVGSYLDRHEGWFRRCAAPMDATPIDAQAYALTLGRFGNFGFEVEPTIGLRLLPQNAGCYAITTVPLNEQDPALADLYDVDFQANLYLETDDSGELSKDLTAVSWDLNLAVWIHLPKMITLLPDGLVQSSGDHLLRQIVRQISRRLTWKVQEDFHTSHGISCPPRRKAAF